MSIKYKAYKIEGGDIQMVEEGSQAELDLLSAGMMSVPIPGLDKVFADRISIVNSIINSGLNNPNISSVYMAMIFKEISGEVLVFERTGIDLITSALQDMVNNNHPLKPALEAEYIPNSGISVLQAISGALGAGT